MQLENFEKLTEKITQFIDLLDRLKQENSQISSSFNQLSAKAYELQEKEKTLVVQNGQLKDELKKLEAKYKAKEQEMKKRIETLLQKLNALGV